MVNLVCPLTATLISDGTDIGLTITDNTLSVLTSDETQVGSHTKTFRVTLLDHLGADVKSNDETVTVVVYGCERNDIVPFSISDRSVEMGKSDVQTLPV